MKTLIFLLLLCPLFSFAQEFKTARAKEANEDYIIENQRLEKLKDKAIAKYEKDLIVAREAAMKAGNLKEAVAINAELEKMGSLETKNVDNSLLDKEEGGETKKGEVKSKNKNQKILLDEHKGRTAAGISEGNTYKFEVEPGGKTYSLKIYFTRTEQKSKSEIFLTDPDQKIISVAKLDPIKENTYKLDVTTNIKGKGLYAFTLNYTEGPSEIHIDKMELIIE